MNNTDAINLLDGELFQIQQKYTVIIILYNSDIKIDWVEFLN